MRHPCDICGVLIGRSFLMCSRHWRLVPPALQRDVYRTWGRVNRPGAVHAKLQAIKDYRTVSKAAVDAARAARPTEGASA